MKLLLHAIATSLALALAHPVHAQTLGCSYGGHADSIPAAGTGDGVYPGTLPSAPLIQSINVVSIPSGATTVTDVRLYDLDHTSVGDLQVVLETPDGIKINLLCRPGGGTSSCDLMGSYFFRGECGGGMSVGSCSGSLSPGAYEQSFGDWPSGAHGIENFSLYGLNAQFGIWTLYVYDWSPGEVGSMTGWSICFGTTSFLPIPDQPTPLAPATNSTVHNPVEFSWNPAHCAAWYRVVIDGVQSARILGTSYSTVVSAGQHSWEVRGENGSGLGPGSPGWMFDIPAPAVTTSCEVGGDGGLVPTYNSGGGGVWQSVPPPYEFDQALVVASVPAHAKLQRVELHGLSHTWIGDLQLVLQDPSGGRHNLLVRPAYGIYQYGSNCNFDGDYAFVQSGGSGDFLNCSTGVLPPGDYNQSLGFGAGTWPDGVCGIYNTPLSAIPVSTGVWRLFIYDWQYFDSGQLTSWDLCFESYSLPSSYCTAGTSTNGCAPSISANTQPSAAFARPCTVSISNTEGQKFGIVFYGVDNSSFAPSPWASASSSYLCVKPPTQRTLAQSSGGTSSMCDGALSLDWNAYQTANPSALGNPFLVGDEIYVQGWFRDPPAPKTTNLSDALHMIVTP